jgi:GLPGLI family protein
MKKLFFTNLLFLLVVQVMAQDIVQHHIVYSFTYIRDLDNKQIPYKEDMVLSVGKTTSRYCSQTLFKNNNKKLIEARKKEQERLASSAVSGPTQVVMGGPMLSIGKAGALIKEEIDVDFKQKKMMIDANIAIRTYHVETEVPTIQWTVANTTKQIGSYTCQNATGNFGGRTYEAWFTTQLPYTAGPWKLTGLPGVILEAYDTAKEIVFNFKEITANTDNEETTQPYLHSQFSINTNLKDLQKARKAFEIDPEGVMSAQAPNARMMVKNIDEPDNKSITKIKTYNAIER